MNRVLSHLQMRHAQLDRQVADEQSHPAVDSLKLQALKRGKLATRDEIARLEAGLTD